MLLGNLGQDPDMRYTSSGTPVCNFSMATQENWTGQGGEKQSRTEWHKIVAWGKLAEICGEWLKKGKQVYIEGKLQTRKWDDREGITRYTTEVVASSMIMLGGGSGGGSQRQEPSEPSGYDGDYRDPQNAVPPDDDIPF